LFVLPNSIMAGTLSFLSFPLHLTTFETVTTFHFSLLKTQKRDIVVPIREDAGRVAWSFPQRGAAC
ncbi:MAG: hypothetical protein AAGU04_09040, partial [Anaerolineaceae bacterium]